MIFIDALWKKRVINIGCSPCDLSHTAENLSDLVSKVLNEWGVFAKINFIMRDGAANMKRMSNLLKIPSGDCANHCLHLCVTSELLKRPNVEGLLEKMRTVTNYFNESILFAAALRQHSEEYGLGNKNLVSDCRTRWNSSLMIVILG